MSIDFVATTELIFLLNDGEYTQVELQNLTGLSNSPIGRWLRKFKQKKLIYICEWRQRGKIKVPVYTWGYEEEDVKKPRPMTQQEYNARSRDKKRMIRLGQLNINERKSV